MSVSFTHVINPFRAKPGSEHARASDVTWRTLDAAIAQARINQIEVDLCAAILPGDEEAVVARSARTVRLTRTVQDVASLAPVRHFPLIADILSSGAAASTHSHLIYSNMDIAVQPQFYVALAEILRHRVPAGASLAVSRINIDAALWDRELHEMYAADGDQGVGYDCFVIPREVVGRLDLGHCCIGAAHFDYLLFIELDVLSDGGVRLFDNERLTFHLGNDIAWSAMLDYVEHNLAECMSCIARIRERCTIFPGGVFDRVDRNHFRRNARLTSRMLRGLRRLPAVGRLVLAGKRLLKRQY